MKLWIWTLLLICGYGIGRGGNEECFGADVPTSSSQINGPLSPEASLERFAIDPQLKIEIVAAEPEIVDPVALQFGADGHLWVVELRDYPHGPKEGSAPRSRIKQLSDADGDGRFEQATIFADELLFVTGVLPYRDGLIVTLAGKIMFLADRDGDGAAEFRETWFSGFAQENSQLRANHPTYGVDGYVYVANGLRGGKVVAERPEWRREGAEPLVITGFDFRFHPETGDFSTVNGHGQFGMSFDDFGRRFVCSNRNPCMHIVLDDRYLKQNPRYAVSQVIQDVCTAGENSRLYPISKAWTTSTLHANQFTAACGVTIFRGDGMPADYYGNAFTCDPTGNLVHREVLEPSGSTFAGHSPYEQREFLASPDTWFRPVNLAHGPDGALYVIDMYRAVIEHPDFMPEELKQRPDLLLGTDRGRIYRITAREKSAAFDEARAKPAAGSLANLAHTNSFQRETTFRLLLENPPQSLSTDLLHTDTAGNRVVGRCLLLRLLSIWDKLQPEQLLSALTDPAPEVRETALILAEQLVAEADIRVAMLARARDKNARVRFQALQSLAMLPIDDELLTALVEVAQRDGADPWAVRAMMTAARETSADLLARLIPLAGTNPELTTRMLPLIHELSVVVAGTGFDSSRGSVWSALATLPETKDLPSINLLRWTILDGFGPQLRRRYASLTQDPSLAPELRSAVAGWLDAAIIVAGDKHADVDLRLLALRISRAVPTDATAGTLLTVAFDDPHVDVQQAAFDALATFPQVDLATPLLQRFAGTTPSGRRGILDILLASDARTAILVEHLEQGRILPTELDPVRVQRLTNHRNPNYRERVKKLISAATAERGTVIDAYLPALQHAANPARGRSIFEKQCVTCHKVGNLGVNVGPDIADTRTKTPDVLLTAILDPNRAIDNNYFGYAVVTAEGQVLTGIIVAETSGSITLRQPEGKMTTILRAEIDELRNTGMSLMPVGFEKNIPPQDMADLVSFLKNWRYLDGDVPASTLAQ